MSRWNHTICDDCWSTENPNREPVRFVGSCRAVEMCCFCGKATRSGIYVRRDPNDSALVCGRLRSEAAP